jgi:hypothetical protein
VFVKIFAQILQKFYFRENHLLLPVFANFFAKLYISWKFHRKNLHEIKLSLEKWSLSYSCLYFVCIFANFSWTAQSKFFDSPVASVNSSDRQTPNIIKKGTHPLARQKGPHLHGIQTRTWDIEIAVYAVPKWKIVCPPNVRLCTRKSYPTYISQLKGAQVWKFSSHWFFYFYTIKPLCVGDFRAKITNSKFFTFRGSVWVTFSKIL